MVSSWSSIWNSQSWWYLDPDPTIIRQSGLLGGVVCPVYSNGKKMDATGNLKQRLKGQVIIIETTKAFIFFDPAIADILIVTRRDVNTSPWEDYAKEGVFWLRNYDRNVKTTLRRIIVNPTFDFVSKEYAARIAEAVGADVDLLKSA